MEEVSRVALVRCDQYDLELVRGAVRRGLDHLGGAGRYAGSGERILLKPNLLVGRSPSRAVNTHPTVFHAVADVFLETGAELSYGDSPGFGPLGSAARRAGIAEVAETLGVPSADFSRGRVVDFSEGRLIKQFTIAAGALDADGIVSLPKLKTHGLTRMTGAIKNQFGCVPGVLKPEFHARLSNVDLFSQMLVDLNRLLRPRLYVMDGVLAMEGNGPQGGSPRPMNVLLFSEDPVALDTVVCRMIDLDPDLVMPIRYGAAYGLGRSKEIEIVGDPLELFTAHDFDVNRRALSTTDTPGRASRIARRLIVPKPVVDPDRCTRCGTCVSVCPIDPSAVAFPSDDRSRHPVHDYGRCVRCYCCQELCPENAIRIHVPLLGRWVRR